MTIWLIKLVDSHYCPAKETILALAPSAERADRFVYEYTQEGGGWLKTVNGWRNHRNQGLDISEYEVLE